MPGVEINWLLLCELRDKLKSICLRLDLIRAELRKYTSSGQTDDSSTFYDPFVDINFMHSSAGELIKDKDSK